MIEEASPLGIRPEANPPLPARAGLVCVGFKGRRIDLFELPPELDLPSGTLVLVEAERGIDVGELLDLPAEKVTRRRDTRPRRILRAATSEEREQLAAARREDREALAIVFERVARFGLPMHLVDAEYQFDRNRVTFYFTADHRVDFRELVRDLAGIFRMRIELRQIGTREAARRLGGLGCCGRECCCSSFLWDFERVTLQMARQQNLAINPSRLSGLCGRLLCCLSYEEGGRDCAACEALDRSAEGAARRP
jgi:cell fate regulator YaaT (PSP1 superfamily)